MTNTVAAIALGIALFVVGLVVIGSSRAEEGDAARLRETGGAICISGLLVIMVGVLWGDTLPYVAIRWAVLILMAVLLSRVSRARGPD